MVNIYKEVEIVRDYFYPEESHESERNFKGEVKYGGAQYSVPMVRGHHICDTEFTKAFKSLFCETLSQEQLN
jgi:hypothetical protein